MLGNLKAFVKYVWCPSAQQTAKRIASPSTNPHCESCVCAFIGERRVKFLGSLANNNGLPITLKIKGEKKEITGFTSETTVQLTYALKRNVFWVTQLVVDTRVIR